MKEVYVSNNVGDSLEHDYDLKYEEGKRVCLYSNNPLWADFLKGTMAGSVKDIDDGFIVKVGEQKMKLGYDDMQVLKILLLSDLEDTDYFEIRESITIKKWPKGIENK